MAKVFLFSQLLLCVLGPSMVRAAEICCDGVCFSNNPPYDGLPLPQCPGQLNMNLQVYTRRNSASGQVIDSSTIPPVFNGFLLSIFIVHGWQQSQDNSWLHTMKNAFLEQGDYNVVIVGWSGGSQNINYFQSVSDTRTAGAEIALVANNTINNGGSTQSRIYCIGFSLGAHVCGHGGERLKFGRITGLDPAGPKYDDRDVSAGLNPSHADLVDVIHTDGIQDLELVKLGSLRRRGHVDFYPNAGGRQPACSALITPLILTLIPTLRDILSMNISILKEDVAQVVMCNHLKSVAYYMESIRTPCFLSRFYSCTDSNNLPLTCSYSFNPVQSLGFTANKYTMRGVFYLPTNFMSPYCKS